MSEQQHGPDLAFRVARSGKPAEIDTQQFFRELFALLDRAGYEPRSYGNAEAFALGTVRAIEVAEARKRFRPFSAPALVNAVLMVAEAVGGPTLDAVRGELGVSAYQPEEGP